MPAAGIFLNLPQVFPFFPESRSWLGPQKELAVGCPDPAAVWGLEQAVELGQLRGPGGVGDPLLLFPAGGREGTGGPGRGVVQVSQSLLASIMEGGAQMTLEGPMGL